MLVLSRNVGQSIVVAESRIDILQIAETVVSIAIKSGFRYSDSITTAHTLQKEESVEVQGTTAKLVAVNILIKSTRPSVRLGILAEPSVPVYRLEVYNCIFNTEYA